MNLEKNVKLRRDLLQSVENITELKSLAFYISSSLKRDTDIVR